MLFYHKIHIVFTFRCSYCDFLALTAVRRHQVSLRASLQDRTGTLQVESPIIL
jgi:hypothetical protein